MDNLCILCNGTEEMNKSNLFEKLRITPPPWGEIHDTYGSLYKGQIHRLYGNSKRIAVIQEEDDIKLISKAPDLLLALIGLLVMNQTDYEEQYGYEGEPGIVRFYSDFSEEVKLIEAATNLSWDKVKAIYQECE